MTTITPVLKHLPRTDSQSTKLLMGWQLLIARFIWWGITLAACIFFVLSLPAYFDQLRTIVDSPAPGSFQIAREDAEGLKSIGISADTFAMFHVGLAIIRAIPCVLVGVLIFFRKPDDRMTLIASLTL